MSMFDVKALQAAYNGTFNGTKTGELTDDKHGTGTFKTIIAHQNGTASFDQINTYEDGTVVERKTTITKDTDGTFHKQTQAFVNGKLCKDAEVDTAVDGNSLTKLVKRYKEDGTVKATLSETVTKNDDGTEKIEGTLTGSKGKLTTISGTAKKIDHGRIIDETLKNAAGDTKTLHVKNTHDGTTSVHFANGTNFSGVHFSYTSTQTLLDEQKTA